MFSKGRLGVGGGSRQLPLFTEEISHVYRCSCGRTFETPGGLNAHRRHAALFAGHPRGAVELRPAKRFYRPINRVRGGDE